jgi:glycosyltransferase involved in cell wall biosynthesis
MYLPEALESALGQTYPDIEVVLVDDGSTDPATIAVLDTLPQHPRLRVLRTPNQGVARARNYGIDQSTGEYILCLDADDRILPTYLEQAIAILDQQPEVGFVGCHYRIFGERTGECRPRAYQLPDLLVENVVPIASVYRRTCWQEVGGYCAKLNSIEDWDLWIGILERSYAGAVLPEILFEYRVRPNSNLSHIRDPNVYEERMRLLYQRHELLYNQYTFDILALKDRQFAQMHSYAMWLEQQAKNWEKVAQERQAMIDILNQSVNAAVLRTIWFQNQVTRWRRITTNNPTMIGRARAIFNGLRRVVVRRVHTMRRYRQ